MVCNWKTAVSSYSVAAAGKLERMTGRELAALATTDNLTLSSIGVAAINALLPPLPDRWVERNAGHVICTRSGQSLGVKDYIHVGNADNFVRGQLYTA